MKAVFISGLVMSCVLASAGGFRIGLEGRGYKNECKDIQVQPDTEIGGRECNRFIAGLKPLTTEWQRFEFSFVPSASKITLALSGTHRSDWVAFDDFQVTGGKLYNPSFEIINPDQEIDGWRYYAKECLQSGDGASQGKNYVVCARDQFYIRTDLTDMVPGRKVTVSFAARKAKEVPVISAKWTSSGKRKVK